MNARASRRAKGKRAEGKGYRHSNQPSREQLRRENDRLLRENEELRRKVAERERQIAEREKQVADGERQIAEREKQIADAEKQIADLERQLALRKQNSTNSSKPPSSDGLAGEARPRGRRKKSRRKAGGQPGHRGAHRPLVPPERVNEIRPVLPEQCQHCRHLLPAQVEQVQTTGTVQRHQVTELPPIQPRIIEYQCHRVICPECGQSTRAEVPEEATGHFGPQLAALIAYLTVNCRMPRRVVEALLGQVLGIEISLGSTQKCWEEASQAVAAPCQELEEQLKNEPVLNVDETGWRDNGDKRFLWAFVAARYVVYTVAATRGSEVLVRLLGAVFQGVLCSDRFSAYLKYHAGSAVLLGTSEAQFVGDCGIHQEQHGGAILPGRVGRARQTVPPLAQVSQRPNRSKPTVAPFAPHSKADFRFGRTASGQSPPRGPQSRHRSFRTQRTAVYLPRTGRR